MGEAAHPGLPGSVDEVLLDRALNFVQVGELSSARQALEGVEIALGNDDIFKPLSDTSKRHDKLRDRDLIWFDSSFHSWSKKKVYLDKQCGHSNATFGSNSVLGTA